MDPREQFGLEFTCLQRVEQPLDAAEIGLVYAKRSDLVGIPFVRVDDDEPLLCGPCVSRIGKAERREAAFGRKADGDDRADADAVRFGDQLYGRQRAGRNDFRVGQYIGTAAGADVCACIRGIGRIGRIRGIGSIRADVRVGALSLSDETATDSSSEASPDTASDGVSDVASPLSPDVASDRVRRQSGFA